jgi:hypothetical protein
MGSKPSSAAADQANAQAQQSAAEARAQEAAHQAQLQQGYQQIQNVFEGAPVMANRNATFDWGNVTRQAAQFPQYQAAGGDITGTQVTGLPTGYHYIQTTTPGTPGTPGTSYQAARGIPYDETVGNATQRAAGNISTNPNVLSSATTRSMAGTPGTPGSVGYTIVGPDGKVYHQGDTINYNEAYDTGQKTGGFGDDFYKNIAANVTKSGELDINDQYNKARTNLLYATARQGLGTSGAADQGVADILTSKGKAETDLANQAADAANQVRSQVASEKQAALTQLYATGDPTVAANTALTNATNIRANKPQYNSLGDIFSGILQGFGTIRNSGYGGFLGSMGGAGGSTSPSARPAQ